MLKKNELYSLEFILKSNGEDLLVEKVMEIISEDKNGYTIRPLSNNADEQYVCKNVLDNNFLTINKVHSSNLQEQEELHLTIVSDNLKTAFSKLLNFIKETTGWVGNEDLKDIIVKGFEGRINHL